MMLSTDSCGAVRGRSSLDRCSRVGLAGPLFAHGCVPSRWVGRLVVTGQLPFSPDASMSVKRLETGAGADQIGAGGGFGDRPASPLPRCFGCWRSLRSCGRRRPVYPPGKGAGNSRRKSATKERRREIRAPQAPTKEGIDGPERTRTIRQDSSQNRKTFL